MIADRQNVWIVVAAFNEQTVIFDIVRDLLGHYDHVVVVDDGSGDLTSAYALQAGAIVISHPVNLGQGAALQTGITYALDQNANLIATFDADGQHQVSDIEVLVKALRDSEAEVALGSRFLGKTVDLPLSRRLLLKTAALFSFFTTKLKLTDAHNGLRLFTGTAATKVRIVQNRMAHASEIVKAIADHKLRYVEVPVTIVYTSYSKQKGQKTVDAARILFDLFMGRLHK